VQTPKLAGAGAEGGATLFETTYFGRKAFLSQSPQLYKQMLMSTGLDRVYEIAPAFRAEPSDTVRHVTEFTSFDGEVAWIEHQEDVFAILEGAVAHAIEHLRRDAKAELERLHADPKVPKLPLKRLPYAEALELLRGQGKRVRDGDDIDTEAEKRIGQAMAEEGHELYFLTEYPTAIKPFYIMAKRDEPEYSFSFDLEYKGDEMASGGQREHRFDMLEQRMREKGLDPEDFDFYTKAFRYGMPPHGGWGFGVDRFVQKLLDLPNIREAILFPRDRVRLVP
jgi:aspartyl-tRNA synthetase